MTQVRPLQPNNLLVGPTGTQPAEESCRLFPKIQHLRPYPLSQGGLPGSRNIQPLAQGSSRLPEKSSANTRDNQIVKGQHKNTTNKSQSNMTSPEPSYPIKTPTVLLLCTCTCASPLTASRSPPGLLGQSTHSSCGHTESAASCSPLGPRTSMRPVRE